eukprot:scaffold262_cov410-Pavlova_lutheri.AAC.1
MFRPGHVPKAVLYGARINAYTACSTGHRAAVDERRSNSEVDAGLESIDRESSLYYWGSVNLLAHSHAVIEGCCCILPGQTLWVSLLQFFEEAFANEAVTR